jgi:DNA transformation protein and related proteins
MTPEYRAFLVELFAGMGEVQVRRVFHFDGLYRDDTMFGLVADERVYLKTDEPSRKAFVAEGAVPFRYRARDGADVATSYYEIPARLYDDTEEASAWARRAYAVALKSPTALRKRVKHGGARQPARRRRGA